MKIKEYTCQSCGSNCFKSLGFDKYMCTFCGIIVQQENDNILRLEVCHKNVERLKVEYRINKEALNMFPREEIDWMMKREISKQITKQLMFGNYLCIENDVNLINCEGWYRGYIEVVRRDKNG